MPSTRLLTTATALAVLATVPSAALAAGAAGDTPILRGSPQMHLVDAHHATLHFASEQIARTGSGAVDAKLSLAGSARHAAAVVLVGTHGGDKTYDVRVSSTTSLKVGTSYTVTFRLGDSAPVQRPVKLYAAKKR